MRVLMVIILKRREDNNLFFMTKTLYKYFIRVLIFDCA